MGKNKHKHHSSQPKPAEPTNQFKPAGPALSEQTKAAATLDAAARHDVPNAILSKSQTIEDEPIDLATVLQQARDARDRWQEGRKQIEKRDAELEHKATQQRERSEKLRQTEQHLQEQEVQLKKDTDALHSLKEEWVKQKTETESEFLNREESLCAREIDATAGFLVRKRDMLTRLEAEVALNAKAEAEQTKHRLESKATYEKDLQSMREELLAGIDKDKTKLRADLRDAEQAKLEANWAKEDALELKTNLGKRVSDHIKTHDIETSAQLDSAYKRIENLSHQLAEKEAAERARGGRSPQELLIEIEQLHKKHTELQDELSHRASVEQTQQLQRLESEHESDLADLSENRRKLHATERLLSQQSIAVGQLETIKDQEAAWKVREAAIRSANEQLKADLERLTGEVNNKKVFSELTRLDDDTDIQTKLESPDPDAYPDLKAVVHRARHAMAHNSEHAQPLFYTETDVRCFLGGLASNRLHLLQGISGTGKSSLPREFARALGWESDFVEVQSSWRDKADLLGYYNAFEKKFYESACLQALYRAQCPRYADRPFFIVLDEMNLSQTEHYFADFLSALEQTESDKRRVTLLSHTISPAPRLLSEGKKITIPDNVWFIGTANHDESTKDFADKTYDRAHVMELPRSHAQFKAVTTRPNALSWPCLNALFTNAQKVHSKQSTDALAFLNRELKNPLAKLDLGWGNRFEKQLKGFLPTLIAAGGTSSEALDHLLATKVLRKLHGRFDLPPQEINELNNSVVNAWAKFAPKDTPVKSLNLLEQEIKRLERRG